MPGTPPSFSAEDANSLLSIAQDAPIPGGQRMAQLRSELYQRFIKFYHDATRAAEAAPKPRKARSGVLRTATEVEDLTK